MFEAFKKGLFDIHPEGDPAAVAAAYDFPAVTEGRVKKDVFKTGTPANMLGFVFNTRKPVFSDRKVRQALAMLFDFEWANKNLFFDAYKRTGSFWQGSQLSALGVPASDAEKALLAPFPDAVGPQIMDGSWKPAATDGSGRDRKVLRTALDLLKQVRVQDRRWQADRPEGKPLAFEIMTKGESEERLAIAYKRTLDIVGIEVADPLGRRCAVSAPGAEFRLRHDCRDRAVLAVAGHRAGIALGLALARHPGSFNFAGAADPAIDALVSAMLQARDPGELHRGGACARPGADLRTLPRSAVPPE